MGTRAIAKNLHDLNIPSCKGTKWCQSAVRRIISQEKYCGDLIHQKILHNISFNSSPIKE